MFLCGLEFYFWWVIFKCEDNQILILEQIHNVEVILEMVFYYRGTLIGWSQMGHFDIIKTEARFAV